MRRPDHEKNRIAWNEMAEVHFRDPKYRVKEFLEGRSSLKSIEQQELGNVSGKRLLHLMCQFGLDTLSWARQGALVTGIDISDRSIELANKLKEAAGLSAEFVRSDVLDLKDVIDGQFDIIYQSYGTHCWISDLDRWAQVVAWFLKPGGTFLMIDGHPIEWIFMEQGGSYFDTEPDRSRNNPDYCDRSYIIRNELVEWQHTVADIVNALIDAGLTIERLGEYDFGYYAIKDDWYRHPEIPGYWYPPGGPSKYPLMFMVKAQKRP